ncbi:hypothetical protein [Pseudoclavibacter sp. Z016]|uniref:hypothetical protein n=1 Tax=Pseudoclavibacter sp. Z016 TaxID=2080581 RepID=UPI0011B0015C|nr:hypothetical protein [Pseudoclavibacter sp. Z016]
MSDWTVSERIEECFPRIGSSGIRCRIAGISVDVMPFGQVEDPEGVSQPAPRGEDLVVFGFRDVHERALRLTLPSGQGIRLSQPAGYVALKMRSWIDRAEYYGSDKDARDLSLAASWYQNTPEIGDRLYDTAEGFEMLSEFDMDTDLAGVRLLSLDAAGQLSPANRNDLARRWAAIGLDALARDFLLPAGGPPSPNADRRRAVVTQFTL